MSDQLLQRAIKLRPALRKVAAGSETEGREFWESARWRLSDAMTAVNESAIGLLASIDDLEKVMEPEPARRKKRESPSD